MVAGHNFLAKVKRMKIKVLPEIDTAGLGGVRTVLEDHRRILVNHEFVDDEDDADIILVHVLDRGKYDPDITYTHGVYPTGNGKWEAWADEVNNRIFENIASSLAVVAVSCWGGSIIEQYTGCKPHIIHNGIFYDEYKHKGNKNGCVLWPKTSVNPTCDPASFIWLAKHGKGKFASIANLNLPNVESFGVQDRATTKKILSGCSICVGTTKEADSLMVMESMACGVPILAYNQGQARDRLKHLQGCYLVEPGDKPGLLKGLEYLQANWQVQSEAAYTFAGFFDWSIQGRKLEALLKETLKEKNKHAKVSIIIPCHNYAGFVGKAIQSAKSQTIPCEVVVVDDGSTDNSGDVIKRAKPNKIITHKVALGVSKARNDGIEKAKGNFIICLDADDMLEPDYAETVLAAFKNRKTAISYTPIRLVDRNDRSLGVKMFTEKRPEEMQIAGANIVPSCCMFRKLWWERADGFDELINFTEDANLWLKMFLLGADHVMATDIPKMLYRSHPRQNSRIHQPPWKIFGKNNKVFEPDPDEIGFILFDEGGLKPRQAIWRLKEIPGTAIRGIIYADDGKYRLNQELQNYLILEPTADIVDVIKKRLEESEEFPA